MWEQEGRSAGGSLNCMFGVCGERDGEFKKKREKGRGEISERRQNDLF